MTLVQTIHGSAHALPPASPPTTKLGARRQKMIAFLERKGAATAKQVAEVLGVKTEAARYLLGNDPLVMPSIADPAPGSPQRWTLRPTEQGQP